MIDAELTAVLLFDGVCPFCSAAATATKRLPEVGSVPWDDPAAQAFLEAQFDETPFALFLADRDAETVRAGEAAARELCHRAGVPVLVRDVVGDSYEAVADAIRTVSGIEREPDPYHDEYPMAEAAIERFADLAANAERTHVPTGD